MSAVIGYTRAELRANPARAWKRDQRFVPLGDLRRLLDAVRACYDDELEPQAIDAIDRIALHLFGTERES